jgi:hypothetical protein
MIIQNGVSNSQCAQQSKAQLIGFLKSLIELTDLIFDLSSIYPFCKTTESEAALVLNRFSPFRYFPTNLDFRNTLSVRPDYEILQGETKR